MKIFHQYYHMKNKHQDTFIYRFFINNFSFFKYNIKLMMFQTEKML
jgi:hypothetical protein